MKKILLIIGLVLFTLLSIAQVTVSNKMIIVHRSWGDYVIDATGRTIEINHEDSISTGDRIFYVDATSGSDLNDGLTTGTAWKTISKINSSTFLAGDIILFKRGGIWQEQLVIPNSGASDNPIIFASYDLGVKPVISGSDVLTGFTSSADTTYGADLVTNGGFDADTDWAKGNAEISDGLLTVLPARNGYADQVILIKDSLYSATFTISGYQWGDAGLSAFSTTGDPMYPNDNGTFTITFNAASTTLRVFAYKDGTSFDNVSVRRVTLGSNPNIWQKTGVTIQPNIAFLNGVLGSEQSSSTACVSAGDWYYDGATDIFYIYSTTDPSGNVELGQRKGLVDLGTHDNITLKNITIQHSNENSNPARALDWSSFALSGTTNTNITISGCTIQDNGFFAIVFTNMSYLLFDNNTIQRNGKSYNNGYNMWIRQTVAGMSNITFTNNQSNYSGVHGFFIRSDSKLNHTTNVAIHGNTFNNNNGTGLYVSKLESSVVYNNTFDSNGDPDNIEEDYAIGITSCDNTDIYNNTITNQLNNDGIQIYSDDNPTYGSANNCRIFNNYISGVTNGNGIATAVLDSDNTQNLLIAHNVVIGADERGIILDGATGTPSSVNVFNNTLCNNGLGGLWISATYPAVVKNNLFYNSTSEHLAHLGSTGLTTSNNLYYGTASAAIYYNGTWTSTANVKNIEPTAQNTDPLFTNAAGGDFTLQSGSPAINNGIDLGITEDILGNPIPSGGGYDIGAYEKQ